MKKNVIALVAGIGLLAPIVANAEMKVGFLGTLSGPSADIGRDQYDAFALAVEQGGGKLGGQVVKLYKEDDQARADVALAATSRLLDKEKVDVVTGLTFANVVVALLGKISATDVPFLGSVAGPSTTAGSQCKKNLFITSWQSDAPAEAMGKFLSDQKIAKVAVAAPNFLGAKDKVAGFKRFYRGQLVEEIYTPLNQLDFSSELVQLQASQPNALFAFYPGGQGVTFLRQYKQAGFQQKLPLYSVQTVEGTTMAAMGEAAVGSVVAEAWTPDSSVPASRRFVEAFEKRFGRTPSSYAAFSYDAAQLLAAAISSVKGETSNKKALTKAIREAKFESVRGPFRFNTNNYPVQNYHVYRVVAGADGKSKFSTIARDVLVNHSDAYAKQCPLEQ
nr:ABC transporter substrate-binding protein [uncultured Cupriavidus sp.]